MNYVLSSLVDAGLIRAKRFKNSKNKMAYRYILTPVGIKSKMQLSRDFLKRKMDEYDVLKNEIEELKRELDFSMIPATAQEIREKKLEEKNRA